MLGPYEVHRLHPNSLVEAESLAFVWKDGLLTISYTSHGLTARSGSSSGKFGARSRKW